MKRPKGPELKMPDVKVPPVLADLFYDLRDRRLLPLVAFVVVAIAAVPFLLGGPAETVPPPSRGESGTATGSVAVSDTTITVVQANPGLRDYHQRLGDRSPTDPFRQHYTAPNLAGADLPEAESSSGSSSQTTFSTGGSEEASGGSTTEGGSSPGTDEGAPPSGGGGTPRLIEFVFDVQVSHTVPTPDGGEKMGEPEVRHRLRALTPLPGEKLSVVTTGGVNLHNGKVYLLVSDDVKSLDGEFTCIARAPGGLCELLEVELGFSVELIYEPTGARYRVKVTKIDAVYDGTVGDERSTRAGFIGPAGAPLPVP